MFPPRPLLLTVLTALSALFLPVAKPAWGIQFGNLSTTYDPVNSRIRYGFTLTTEASDPSFGSFVFGDARRLGSSSPTLLSLAVTGLPPSSVTYQSVGPFVDQFVFSPSLSTAGSFNFDYILGNVTSFQPNLSVSAVNTGFAALPDGSTDFVLSNTALDQATIGTVPEAVPEPFTVLGSLAAVLGMGGAAYKRRVSSPNADKAA